MYSVPLYNHQALHGQAAYIPPYPKSALVQRFRDVFRDGQFMSTFEIFILDI